MSFASASHEAGLEKFSKSLKGRPLEASVENLISLLNRRQIRGSEPCALATANLLLQVVARSKWSNVDQLLEQVCQVGRRLVQAQPRELVVGNIVRRVLGLIRDEAVENRAAELATPAPITPFTPAFTRQNSAAHYFSNARAHALHARLPTPARPTPAKANSAYYQGGPGSFLNGAPGGSVQGDVEALRSEIIDGIEEIKDEIEQVDDQIASFAIVHIIPGDYVLVHRPSTAIRRFLSKAATRRKFTVLIITNAWQDPSSEVSNKTMRKELGNAGIPSINVMSSGVTAYMPRVKKVILAARALLAGGDAVVDAGAGTIARAAKRQGAVVTVLAGVYKLSPGKGCQDGLVEWGEPSRHDDFADGSMVDGIKVMTAVTEVVSAASIDVYISNLGTHSRSHLSSIIGEHYKDEDVDFHTQAEQDT